MEQHDNGGDDQPGDGEPQQVKPEEHRDLPIPKVWIASLSDYNAGRLHGAWIEVTDEEALRAGIRSVLADSPEPSAEEFSIFDYDGFGPLWLSEHESVEDVARLAAGIAEHGLAFAHFARLIDWRLREGLDRFTEVYQGHYADLAAYGRAALKDYGFLDAIQELPELLIPYVRINAKKFAMDMEMGGMIFTSEGDGGIYVFDVH